MMLLLLCIVPLLSCLHSVTSFVFSVNHAQLKSISCSFTTTTTTTRTPPSQFWMEGRTPGRARNHDTRLQESLWDRLNIEEDEEPRWYVLNCVAGLEIDLLRQCQQACGDMPDVVKFVVPTFRETRSHGANRMITEEKVKYQGYVFAKLRLCPGVYDAIRTLSLCRSWMGPVNQKGYRKLPPAPVALNEEEIEKFGLEEYNSEEAEAVNENESDVILDSDDDEEGDKHSKPKVDEESLKVYLGLRVEDMVKVKAKGKFFNEDGIVRRLKGGKIMVRFYTYGSMYDEWLEPSDVRKLSNIEILKGLSGPSQPITQNDFEGGGDTNDYRERGSTRRDLMANVRGAVGPRNRRQDRVERGYRSNNSDDAFGQRRREDQNWSGYQDRRRQGQFEDRRFNNQDRRPNRYDSALTDENSQWGRGQPQSQQQQQDRRFPNRFNDRRPNNNNNNNNSYRSQDSRRASNAIQGSDDWSEFVAPAARGGQQKQERSSPGGTSDEDDFFASLMSDLTDAVDSDNRKKKQDTSRGRDTKSKSNDGDDFFASLMSEMSSSGSSSSKGKADSADDFFAALEAELGSAFDKPVTSPEKVGTINSPGGNAKSIDGDDGADDFFARLEAEISTSKTGSNQYVVADSSETTLSEASASSSNVKSSRKQGDGKTLLVDTETPSPKRRKGGSAVRSVGDGNNLPSETVSAALEEKPAATFKPNVAALDKCTVPVLKEMLRERGLKLTGKKSELIERLTQS